MLTKLVNGEPVAMTTDEETALRAEWEYNDAHPPVAPTPTKEQLLAKIDELQAQVNALP